MMRNIIPQATGAAVAIISVVALAWMVVAVTPSAYAQGSATPPPPLPPSATRADEAEAKRLVKAMSDYLAAQKTISFAFDTNFEVVTKEQQKLSLMSSGTVNLSRPDKVRSTRHGGFANVETNFDGKTLTLLGKNSNFYLQVEVPARSTI